MRRGILRDENSVILANSEHGSGEFWKILLLMENSGCLCGIWMLVRILLLATLCLDLFWSNLVSPVDAPPSFPGTLSEIRVHEKTHLETPRRERVKWDEMIHVMSCYYVSVSCHVMACRRGWFLVWPPCHIWQWEFAGTFSRWHRWAFVGPCHLCVHGPPAYTLWFRVSHTHTLPREGGKFKVRTMRWKWNWKELKIRWRWKWDESYLTRTRRGERKRRGKEQTPTQANLAQSGQILKGQGKREAEADGNGTRPAEGGEDGSA